METVYEILKWVPAGIVCIVFGTIFVLLKKDEIRRDRLWDEEEKRQQRVKDLYPAPPSYEERMGVRYGPKRAE